MFLVSQSIDNQGIDALKVRELIFRNGLHIGNIEEISDAEPNDREFAVEDADREYADGTIILILKDDRHMGLDGEQINSWYSWIALVLRCEAIWYAFDEVVGTELFSIDINIAKDAVRAQIIKSAHMVVVFVGNKHGIKFAEVYTKHLLTEVWSTINEYATTIYIYNSTTTQPSVTRISAGADCAVASYLWDTT